MGVMHVGGLSFNCFPCVRLGNFVKKARNSALTRENGKMFKGTSERVFTWRLNMYVKMEKAGASSPRFTADDF